MATTKAQGHLQDFFTGIFMAAVVALLAFFTIVISGVDWLGGSRTVVRTVRFEHIGNLKTQDPVFVRGLKVGSVQSLALADGAVEAKIRIDSAVALHEGYRISVEQTSLLGGSCLHVEEGDLAAPLAPFDGALRGETPTDMMKELGGLVADLHDAVNPEDLRATLDNVRSASEDFADLTGRIRRGEGFVGQLLANDSTAYNDLSTAFANFREVSDGLREGRGFVGKLLREEDSTYEDFHAVVANFREVSDGLKEGQGLLGKLLRAEDSSYEDLSAALANIRAVTAKLNDPGSGLGRLLGADSTLVGDLESTAANLRAVTAKLEQGEGTLGKLVNDDAIALEVEAAIKDVRQIIDNMRDTAPITTFSSLFFSGL